MENGKQPIVPGRFYKEGENYFLLDENQNVRNQIKTIGLTKREYFAAKAMQGLLASDRSWSFGDCVEYSVRYADALLKELAKEVKQ